MMRGRGEAIRSSVSARELRASYERRAEVKYLKRKERDIVTLFREQLFTVLVSDEN